MSYKIINMKRLFFLIVALSVYSVTLGQVYILNEDFVTASGTNPSIGME